MQSKDALFSPFLSCVSALNGESAEPSFAAKMIDCEHDTGRRKLP